MKLIKYIDNGSLAFGIIRIDGERDCLATAELDNIQQWVKISLIAYSSPDLLSMALYDTNIYVLDRGEHMLIKYYADEYKPVSVQRSLPKEIWQDSASKTLTQAFCINPNNGELYIGGSKILAVSKDDGETWAFIPGFKDGEVDPVIIATNGRIVIVTTTLLNSIYIGAVEGLYEGVKEYKLNSTSKIYSVQFIDNNANMFFLIYEDGTVDSFNYNFSSPYTVNISKINSIIVPEFSIYDNINAKIADAILFDGMHMGVALQPPENTSYKTRFTAANITSLGNVDITDSSEIPTSNINRLTLPTLSFRNPYSFYLDYSGDLYAGGNNYPWQKIDILLAYAG